MLSPLTQRARRYLIEQFVAKHGNCAVVDNVLSVIRILMALAMEEGLRTSGSRH